MYIYVNCYHVRQVWQVYVIDSNCTSWMEESERIMSCCLSIIDRKRTFEINKGVFLMRKIALKS